MKVNVLRTIQIVLPEPIINECSCCDVKSEIPYFYLNENEAKELYNQLKEIFKNE